MTGNPADLLTGEDFAPQQIPGAINAYSALKITSIPAFSNLPDTEYDSYTIVARAYDEVGNFSEASHIIAVMADQKPEVKEVVSEQSGYYVQETINLDIFAVDDRGVESH